MEILSNTGAKLWSKDDYSELWLSVFEQITGTAGKSNIRLIDEAIGKLNSALDGYYFSYENDCLYISHKDDDENIKKFSVSLFNSNGITASKVDDSTIMIDENGTLYANVDDDFSETSIIPLQNKVITTKIKSIEGDISTAITTLSKHIDNIDSHVTKTEKNSWNDKYTKNEVDNKFSTLETNLDWKESVETYDDVLTTYPKPEKGWTVNTTDTTYRYNGTEWVNIGITSIPKATQELDGLLSKEDKVKYDDANDKKHEHSNKDILDAITASYTTEEKEKLADIEVATTNKVGTVKPDGDTITIDVDGTLHGSSQVDEMTGATSDADGTSGVVPKPVTGDENKFLRGDAIWATIDLSSKADNIYYDEDNSELQLKSGDNVLSTVTIKGGGGIGVFTPQDCSDISIQPANATLTLKWSDPQDTEIDGLKLSTWAGTKVVINTDHYPVNVEDGDLVLNNTERNKYKDVGYTISELTNDTLYYISLFPYSTDDIYNKSTNNRISGMPALAKLDPTTNFLVNPADSSALISWTDPDATKTTDGVTATWVKTVVMYKEDSYPIDVNDGIEAVIETTRNQYSTEGYTVTGLENGKTYYFATFVISDVGSIAFDENQRGKAELFSKINLTTSETELYGQTVTITNSKDTVTSVLSSSGSCSVIINWLGQTTITSVGASDTATSKLDISEFKTYSIDLSYLKIVTFADGTDEEIEAMVNAHYANKINIADYWSVGDMRTVSLSAMSATGVSESHVAQDQQFVIIGIEHDDLAEPINDKTKAAITVQPLRMLSNKTTRESGYMNSSNTNNGGWEGCARRTWCNNVFINALPFYLQSSLKSVNKKNFKVHNSSTITTTSDKAFLLSETEIFGTITYSKANTEGTQYDYYKSSSNRVKYQGNATSQGSASYWWERSPDSSGSGSFCRVNGDGSAYCYYASSTYGLCPAICL